MSKVMIATIAALGLSLAQPAAATIYLATYTGHFIGGAASSQDVTGLFGAPRTSLDGTAYKAVFRIDDALPGASVYVPIDPYHDGTQIQGGTNYQSNVLPVSATITVNSRTQSFLGAASSVAIQIHHNYDEILDYVNGGRGSLFAQVLQFEPVEFLSSPDLRTPLEYDVPNSASSASISFSIYQNDPTTYDYAFGYGAIDHLSITAGSAVPEPAGWALLIAGVGLVGVALRRRGAIDLPVTA